METQARQHSRWDKWRSLGLPGGWLFLGALVGNAGCLLWLRLTGTYSPISFSAGLVVGGLILAGPRWWPVTSLGGLAALWLVGPADSLLLAAEVAVAIPVGACCMATLKRRLNVGPSEALETRSLLGVFAAAVAAAMVISLLSVAGLVVAGRSTALFQEFLQHFARNALGTMLAAPLVLSWGTPTYERWRIGKWLGFLAAIILCAGAASIVFLTPRYVPIAWAVSPPLILVALGWHLRGVALALVTTATIVLWGTGARLGPFAMDDAGTGTIFAQMFMTVTAATMLLLATYADERRGREKLRVADAERLMAQRAREESEKRLRLAQEAAGVGVWEIDLVNGGSRHSGESARMFGLKSREGSYRLADFQPMLGEDQVATLRTAIGEATQNRGSLEMLLEVTLPESKSRWVSLQGRYDPQEGNPRLLGLSIDVTRDIEAQAKLQRLNDKLLRAARLTAVGAMASTLAHELNQPLTAATNFLEGARFRLGMADESDTAALEALARSREQILRAGDIIRRIRAFTVSGEVASSPLDLEAIIHAACASVAKLGIAKNVQISCSVKAVPARLIGDPVQIEQVISNLLRNAVEAVECSERRNVSLTTLVRSKHILVRIDDSGPGMSDELLENLFEPFRTSKENGTGLGLPICRSIIEAHGGKLKAENKAKGGARFSFSLPLTHGFPDRTAG